VASTGGTLPPNMCILYNQWAITAMNGLTNLLLFVENKMAVPFSDQSISSEKILN
jgi:hypothetical protein